MQHLLSRILPSKRAESKQEILDNLKLAEQDGIVAQDAYDMMQRVMLVSDLKVRDIMIPRSNMIHVEKEDDLDRCLDVMVCLLYTSPSPRDKRQSRMPSSA